MTKHLGAWLRPVLVALGIVWPGAHDANATQSKPDGGAPKAPPDLRGMALGVAPARLGLQPTKEHPHVWQIFMETGYPKGVATLVVAADGSASLYLSGGGGIIGAGEHKTVREAAGAFLASAEGHLGKFGPATAAPLPLVGRVRFFVRTFDGSFAAEASEADLGNNRHPLSPVFHAGHAVIAAMREATERK